MSVADKLSRQRQRAFAERVSLLDVRLCPEWCCAKWSSASEVVCCCKSGRIALGFESDASGSEVDGAAEKLLRKRVFLYLALHSSNPPK